MGLLVNWSIISTSSPPCLFSVDGDGGGIYVDALACWMYQNISKVPKHVPSNGCSEILEQTRSITQLNGHALHAAMNLTSALIATTGGNSAGHAASNLQSLRGYVEGEEAST